MSAPGRFSEHHRSELCGVSTYACACPHCEWGPEEHSDCDSIVFVRQGAFTRRIGNEEFVHDACTAAVFQRGQTYRAGHPKDAPRDRCSVLRFEPALISHALRAEGVRHDEPRLPWHAIPLSASLWAAHARLAALASCPAPEPLAWDESGAAVLHACVRALQERERVRAREDTVAAHRALVDRCRWALSQGLSQNLALADLARRVHASPYHLARVFRAGTGMSLSAYRTRLRVTAALDRLGQGETNLARLAADLGFFDHSHLCGTLRKFVGRSPTECRASPWVLGDLGTRIQAAPRRRL